VAAAQTAAPTELPAGPAPLPALKLSDNATPVKPGDAPASLPTANSEVIDPATNTRIDMAGVVAGEDLRLRTLLHHSNRLIGPTVVPIPGALPTLVLPHRVEPYTLADLQARGAVVPLSQGNSLLVDSVLVMPSATLNLGGAGLSTLLMNSTAAGFTSLVTWGGTLTLSGDPLTITGWDHVHGVAAQNTGHGRPYIRAVGGRLELNNVHASSLGFWSGRTGGVAWTGISHRPSTGSAVSSTFIGNTYGAFVSRADQVEFRDDLFQSNELDGLRLHRDANGIKVTASAAARNGANGFVVGRGATGDVLRGDLAVHNAGNGFYLDGQPLVSGASPSGGRTVASVGTRLEGSDSENNLRSGILVGGGNGTAIEKNVVVGSATGIAVRSGASNTTISANEVRSSSRVSLSIGPAVTGTTVVGNTLLQARIGVLVRNSPGIRLMNNRIGGMSIFAISVRGASPGIVGNDNILSGRGLQPIDVRAGASAPVLTGTNLKGWLHRSQLSWQGYLRYHPLLATWLVILVLVTVAQIVARIRRRVARPYLHTVAWQSPEDALRIVTGRHPAPATAHQMTETMEVAANGRTMAEVGA
jgi:parallel beta-helix repeat protein